MNQSDERKLKIDFSPLYKFLAGFFTGMLILITIILIVKQKPGLELNSVDYYIMSSYVIFALSQLIAFFRTKNYVYFGISIILFLYIPFLIVSTSEYREYRFVFAIIWVILFLLFGPLRKKFNPHFRQVLELAARSVQGTQNGYSGRPYPVGKEHYSKDDVIGYAKFLMKNWITTSYFEKDRVVLKLSVFSLRDYLFLKPDYSKITYVSFDFNGEIFVHVSQRDYKKYKDELTFDQLCSSLGNLFKEFLSYYIEGKSGKILKMIEDEMLRSHAFFSFFSESETINPEVGEGE